MSKLEAERLSHLFKVILLSFGRNQIRPTPKLPLGLWVILSYLIKLCCALEQEESFKMPPPTPLNLMQCLGATSHDTQFPDIGPSCVTLGRFLNIIGVGVFI